MESCGEGGTVRCLLENAGVFTEIARQWGIDSWEERWYEVRELTRCYSIRSGVSSFSPYHQAMFRHIPQDPAQATSRSVFG